MTDILITYQNYFYWFWVILLIVRMELNQIIYSKTQPDAIDSLYTPWKLDGEAYVLIIFTFWWNEYKTEQELKLKMLMRISNVLNMFFIAYTIFVSILYLYIINI